jgi:hypothetical protein
MSIINRVQRLEQKQAMKNECLHIALFIVKPRVEPKGYICEGVVILVSVQPRHMAILMVDVI